MPICPRCNATIHAEARKKCPACGYSLTLQEVTQGDKDVVFPRVKDEAGVLTQQERESLMRTLANLERYIPPVALCVYLTNHGQSQEFRSRAHWILNHAHIHTPSFGQREAKRAIEDAELRELTPEEKERRRQEQMQEEGPLARFWHWLKDKYNSRFSKCPPPVRHEWMLILVVDVQLKMACFSWGYMLDPYINPDKINSCITSARLQFRERARVPALEHVMKKASKQLAANARRVNKELKKGKRITSPLLAGLLGLSLFSAAPLCEAKPAARPATAPTAQAAKPAMEDDMVAVDDEEEEVAVDDEAPATPAPATPTPTPAKPTAPPAVGTPASYGKSPVWHQGDYTRLMAGELTACYRTLLPGNTVRTVPAPAKGKGTDSEVRVLRSYCQEYNRPTAAGLCDPQGLLSSVERNDIEFILNELNANVPFKLYVAVFKAGQEIPQELNPTTLTTATAQPDEHAAMILYSIGDIPDVQIGYREINPTDDQRRDWLQSTQQAANQAGGNFNGLIAALYCLRSRILPISKDFRPLTASAGEKLPRIPLEFGNKKEVKPPSMKMRIKEWVENPENKPTIFTALAAVVLAGLVAIWLYFHRSVVRLMDTTPDYRLSSPYGAGVSRYVRYLDGKEAAKEPPLF